MNLSPQIAFRNVSPSPALESYVRERIEKLDTFSKNIVSCRVMLETSHRHRHTGRDYHCRIDLKIPGAELVVGRDPPLDRVHEDLYSAIDAAFDVAQRLIEDFERRHRGFERARERPQRGQVVRLARRRGYGFLEGPDGYEVYFHRNSVLDPGFDALEVGSIVRFTEEPGENGPQASSVSLSRVRRAEGANTIAPAIVARGRAT